MALTSSNNETSLPTDEGQFDKDQPGVGIVIQGVNMPLATLTFHMGAWFQILNGLLLIQFPTTVPGKVAEDCLST